MNKTEIATQLMCAVLSNSNMDYQKLLDVFVNDEKIWANRVNSLAEKILEKTTENTKQ